MLNVADLEPLVRPVSTCPACSSTDVKLKGINNHLQMDLVCTNCGSTRKAIVLVSLDPIQKSDSPLEEPKPIPQG
jgi:hypothetical protein